MLHKSLPATLPAFTLLLLLVPFDFLSEHSLKTASSFARGQGA